MTVNFSLVQESQIIDLLANNPDAAGRTSSYVHLGNAQRASIVVKLTQGNAATVQLSPLQATTSAGANSKALPAVPIASNLDSATSDVMVARTAAVNYTTDAALKNKIVVFDIDPSVLDTNNGFKYLGLSTGASNAANITSALLILMPIKERGQTPPTTTGL